MNAKLACADFTFPLLPHAHALELIAMLGFRGVDLGLFEGRSHLQPSTEFVRTRARARKLKTALDARGLVAADVFLQAGPDPAAFAINHRSAARRQRARDWFLHTLDYANALGCRHVTTLPGTEQAGETRGASFDRAVTELTWRAEQSRDAGLEFGFEAHVGSLVPTPEETLTLLKQSPQLTLTLDYTHFVRAGIAIRRIERLVPHASHFHARAACLGRLQCNLEDNTIDYSRALSALARAGYRGWLGVEYVWTAWERCNESDNLSETIRLRDVLLAAESRRRVPGRM